MLTHKRNPLHPEAELQLAWFILKRKCSSPHPEQEVLFILKRNCNSSSLS
jgi:hypothetical protein